MKKGAIFSIIFVLIVITASCSKNLDNSTPEKQRKLIVITIDGYRWQELFTGADKDLIEDSTYNKNVALIKEKYWRDSPEERRKALMPFIWGKASSKGIIFGNRLKNSNVNVTNNFWFSYPGYSEMFIGWADNKRIKNNNKIPNPNINVFEAANKLDKLKDKVLLFGSWSIFSYIFNEKRSKLIVNDGWKKSLNENPAKVEKAINEINKLIPITWKGERSDGFNKYNKFSYYDELETAKKPILQLIGLLKPNDYGHGKDYTRDIKSVASKYQIINKIYKYTQADPYYKDGFTYYYALESIKTKKPLVTFIGLGETDEFGHGKDYTKYLEAAASSDEIIKRIWEYTQSDPFYKDKTTFIITCDHGRGKGVKKNESWTTHGRDIAGSDQTWMIFFGNGIKNGGEQESSPQIHNNQIAATIAEIMGFEFDSKHKIGESIFPIIKN